MRVDGQSEEKIHSDSGKCGVRKVLEVEMKAGEREGSYPKSYGEREILSDLYPR